MNQCCRSGCRKTRREQGVGRHLENQDTRMRCPRDRIYSFGPSIKDTFRRPSCHSVNDRSSGVYKHGVTMCYKDFTAETAPTVTGRAHSEIRNNGANGITERSFCSVRVRAAAPSIA